MKILLIFDQDVLLKTFERMFLVCGIDTKGIEARFEPSDSVTRYSVTTEEQILAEARAYSPDCVVMMLQGFHTRQIETAVKLQQLKLMRFLFLSAHPHDDELEEAQKAGLQCEFRFVPLSVPEIGEALGIELRKKSV